MTGHCFGCRGLVVLLYGGVGVGDGSQMRTGVGFAGRRESGDVLIGAASWTRSALLSVLIEIIVGGTGISGFLRRPPPLALAVRRPGLGPLIVCGRFWGLHRSGTRCGIARIARHEIGLCYLLLVHWSLSAGALLLPPEWP